MKLIEKETFVFENKNYEIHVFNDGWEITVRTYYNGKPANGYKYSVSLPTAFDLFKITQTDAVKVLKERAKKDVEDNLWNRYVENYIANLNKPTKELLGCKKCHNRNINSSFVDDREMYECIDCGNIWYEERKICNPFTTIIDDITEGVEKKGYYEIDVAILLNAAFREDGNVGLSFLDQVKNWANKNKLQFQRNSFSEPQIIKFWR